MKKYILYLLVLTVFFNCKNKSTNYSDLSMENNVEKALQVLLNVIIHCRSCYHNILAYYTLSKNALYGGILFLVVLKCNGSKISSKLIQRIVELISNSLLYDDQLLDFITILCKLISFTNPIIEEKDLNMKGMKIVTVNVDSYSLENEIQHERIRTRSQREVEYYANQIKHLSLEEMEAELHNQFEFDKIMSELNLNTSDIDETEDLEQKLTDV